MHASMPAAVHCAARLAQAAPLFSWLLFTATIAAVQTRLAQAVRAGSRADCCMARGARSRPALQHLALLGGPSPSNTPTAASIDGRNHTYADPTPFYACVRMRVQLLGEGNAVIHRQRALNPDTALAVREGRGGCGEGHVGGCTTPRSTCSPHCPTCMGRRMGGQ